MMHFAMTRRRGGQMLAGLAAVLAAPHVTRAQQKTNVTLTAFTGLFQDRYTAAVIQPFMAANPDISITYFAQPTAAQMLGTVRAQRAAPQVDIAWMDMSVTKAGTDEGLFEMLDESIIPNIAELYPAARIPGLAGPAITFDNVMLLYNTEQVRTPPTSWMALADPAWRGKVVIPGIPDIVGVSLVAMLDKINNGQGIANRFEAGIVAMGAIAPGVQTWNPQPEVYVPIISGQAAIGCGWNARAQVNTDLSNGRLRAVLPQEGTVLQISTINLVKNGPQPAAAKRFINYALGQEAQKAFTESMFYAPTNARAQISPAAIARTAAGSMDKVVQVDWLAVAGIRDQLAETWRRRVVPLSR